MLHLSILSSNKPLTMSSREIAELTNKNHAHVLRDIENIETELGESISGLSSYVSEQNKELPMKLLNKENTLLLVSGYSIQLRQKIIKRWQELENRSPKTPNTYLEALEQLIITVKENERLTAQNNALMHTMKTYTTGELAKELNLKSAKQLNLILRDKGIQYKLNGTWVLYAKFADIGLVEIKQGETETGHIYYNSQWTQRGRSFVIGLLQEQGVA